MRPPTLIVLRALKIGDLVTATPALRALARAFPLHRRVLCAPAALEPLVSLTGAVNEVVDAVPLAPLPRSLERSAVAVNLHGRGPQSTRTLAALEPERLVTFAGAGFEGPQWRPDEHEVRRWCRLLDDAGIPADARDLWLRRPDVEPPPIAVGATVVHPGASSPARRWPARRFAAVARAELQASRRVVVTGAAEDVPLACEVAACAGLPDEAVLAGRTSLLESAAVIAAAARVCSNDTGVAHLATAFGTPSVVLFGPVPPSEWGPPPDRPHHRALWAGRRGDPHASTVDPGLLHITVDDVVGALATL